MQAKTEYAGVSGFCRILVEHRGETLEFNGSVYQQAFKKGTYEPFLQINKFWSRLDLSAQDELFNLYKETKNIFNNVFQVNKLIVQLRPVVRDILKFHDSVDIERWTQYHAGVWIPEDLDHEYKYTHEKPGSREQTYLVPDYWELVFFVMKMRSIAPIFGEFVEITKKESGPQFRDLNAYYLFEQTPIEEGPAMRRLNNYVAKNVKQDDINVRAAIEGIGSDVYQKSLVASILVRFLVIWSLTRAPSDIHLVQIIHKTLRNRLSQNESHQNAILEKLNPNEDSDSEDSSSRAERYKNKQPVAAGEHVAVEKYIEYVEQIGARLLCKSELSKEEAEQLHETLAVTEAMNDFALEECQVRLIQYVMNPLISARATWDINKSYVNKLAGLSQFALWQYGFKDLAGIVTARSMNSEGYGSFSPETRAHIPKELIEKINELYPFYRRHPVKKTVKVTNEVIVEIMDLAQQLGNHTWFLNMAEDQIAATRGSATNKTVRMGYDIRIRLTELVIYLQQRNREYISLYTF